jgi:hypothetical protein
MANKHDAPQTFLADTREQWPIMSGYERFEQALFGMIMTLLIAMERQGALASPDDS